MPTWSLSLGNWTSVLRLYTLSTVDLSLSINLLRMVFDGMRTLVSAITLKCSGYAAVGDLSLDRPHTAI